MPFGRNSAASIDAYDAAEAHLPASPFQDRCRQNAHGRTQLWGTTVLAVQSSLPALSEDPPFKSCLLFDPWVEPLPERALPAGWAISLHSPYVAAWGCDQKAKFHDQIGACCWISLSAPGPSSPPCQGLCTIGSLMFPWGPWTLLKFMDLAADGRMLQVPTQWETACAFMGYRQRRSAGFRIEMKSRRRLTDCFSSVKMRVCTIYIYFIYIYSNISPRSARRVKAVGRASVQMRQAFTSQHQRHPFTSHPSHRKCSHANGESGCVTVQSRPKHSTVPSPRRTKSAARTERLGAGGFIRVSSG